MQELCRRTAIQEDGEDVSLFQRLSREAKPTWWQVPLRRLVRSWVFEIFFAAVIFTNSIFIAYQVEIAARNLGSKPDSVLFLIASAYTFLFTFEWIVRIAAWGPRDWHWMALDTAVVLSSLFEFALELPMHQEHSSSTISNMRLLRVLRVAKVTRALRIVRVVKFVRSLKSLLFCIGRTIRPLVLSFQYAFRRICMNGPAALSILIEAVKSSRALRAGSLATTSAVSKFSSDAGQLPFWRLSGQ
eukprot:g11018.t1